jgi:hypothetical protein
MMKQLSPEQVFEKMLPEGEFTLGKYHVKNGQVHLCLQMTDEVMVDCQLGESLENIVNRFIGEELPFEHPPTGTKVEANSDPRNWTKHMDIGPYPLKLRSTK